MHLLQSGIKSIPLKHNPRSIEYKTSLKNQKIVKESEIKEGTTSQEEAHLKSSKGDLSEGSADLGAKDHDHDTRSDDVSGDDSVQPPENQDMTVIAR